MNTKSIRIRALNDEFRTTLQGGRALMTAGVSALPADVMARAIALVRGFDAFTTDNDQHGEHDFGSFEVARQRLFQKIDYYDSSMEHGSEDPADPNQTIRVLTIMLAEEYQPLVATPTIGRGPFQKTANRWTPQTKPNTVVAALEFAPGQVVRIAGGQGAFAPYIASSLEPRNINNLAYV